MSTIKLKNISLDDNINISNLFKDVLNNTINAINFEHEQHEEYLKDKNNRYKEYDEGYTKALENIMKVINKNLDEKLKELK